MMSTIDVTQRRWRRRTVGGVPERCHSRRCYLVHRFLPHRAAMAFLAIAFRLAGDRAAAQAWPPLDAPKRERATAAWFRVSAASAGACPVASWTICHAS